MSEVSRISEINFQNKRGYNDCFLVAALSLLLSCEDFSQALQTFQLPCRGPPHYCLACGLKSLAKDSASTKSLDISKLRSELARVFKEKERFQLNAPSDAMEALTDLLNCLHCIFLNDTTQTFADDVLSINCKEKCPAHRCFSLSVEETYTCDCGEFSQTSWDNSNYCQYLNIAEVLCQADGDRSTALLSVPNFKLKSFQQETNAVGLKSKMIQILKIKLANAEADFCSNNCDLAKSKITFRLEKPPRYYLLNTIWDSEDYGHLDSYLATISISICINLNDVYGRSKDLDYNIKGIMFYGREHYEYACRYGLEWTFNGLGPGCGWYELLREITIMKYRPICILYESSNKTFSLDIEDVQLKKLEKLACECDSYQMMLGEEVVEGQESNSGLFVRGKKQGNSVVKKEHSGNGGGREGTGYSTNYREEVDVPKGVKEEIPIRSSNLEQRVANPAPKSEVNRIDVNKSEVLKQNPTENPVPKEPLPSQSAIKPQQRIAEVPVARPKQDHNIGTKDIATEPFQPKVFKQVPEPSRAPAALPVEKAKPNVWVCDCGSSNQSDWEVCQKCKIVLRPGLIGWVCKGCTVRNEDINSRRCEVCFTDKFQAQVIADNWKCGGCESFNVGTRIYCSNCRRKKDEEGPEEVKEPVKVTQPVIIDDPKSDWACSTCGQNNRYYYRDKCSKCESPKEKKSDPSRTIDKSPSTWVCKCKSVNDNSSTYCKNCFESKNSPEILNPSKPTDSATTWLCKCKKINDQSSTFCMGCYDSRRTGEVVNPTPKIIPKLVPEEPVNEDWTCKSCGKANFHFSTYCTKCYEGRAKPEPAKPKNTIKCPNCSTENTEGSKVCFFCKKSLFAPRAVRECWSCKQENELSSAKCVFCGSPKDKPKAENPAPQNRGWVCTCGETNSMAAARCIRCKRSKAEPVAPPVVQPASAICSECRTQLRIVECPNCGDIVRMAETCTKCRRPMKGIKICSACIEKAKEKEKEKARASASKACRACGKANRTTALKCISCSRLFR